jgi:AraC-like DNA-binding protein
VSLIAALIGDLHGCARIRRAVSPTAELVSCKGQPELIKVMRTRSPTAALVEPWDSTGAPTAPTVRTIKVAFPSIPVVVYLALTPDSCHEVLHLAGAGADELVIRGVDDGGARLRAVLLRAEMRCRTASIFAALAPLLDADAMSFVQHCLEHARESLTVQGVAAALGVHRKTLVNRTAATRLPTPSVVIAWCRLLAAAQMLQDPGRSVEQTALALGLSSGTALRTMFRRYTGLRVSDVREHGGLDSVVALFRRVLEGRGGIETVAHWKRGVPHHRLVHSSRTPHLLSLTAVPPAAAPIPRG